MDVVVVVIGLIVFYVFVIDVINNVFLFLVLVDVAVVAVDLVVLNVFVVEDGSSPVSSL